MENVLVYFIILLGSQPGEYAGEVARLLYQGECGHEAEADAHKDGVGQLPAGTLDNWGVVVLDEHTGGDDGDKDAYKQLHYNL